MHGSFSLWMSLSVTLALAGCVAEVTPPRAKVVVSSPEVYVPAPPRAVVSVYVEPPISEPAPIAIGWAPPPLLVESPPPPPFDAAVWVGGYWVWQGDWVWAHGHWVAPPRPDYVWVHPYYEHRDGVVLFITGHWSSPGVAFVPPPPGIHLSVEVAALGVVPGPRPIGPNGCFIPAPPGSRPGIIVPAPVGTAPAVVTGAPPVVRVGMRVTTNVGNTTVVHDNSVVNNTSNNVTNVRNVTNITNVTFVAPPGATANGQAVNSSVPAQAHLAAAQPAVFKAQAPEPASTKPIPAFVHGKPPTALPPPQPLSTSPSPPAHTNSQQAENSPRPENQGHAGPNAEVAKHADQPPEPTQPAAGTQPVAGNKSQSPVTGDSHESASRQVSANAQAAAKRYKSEEGKHPNAHKPSAKDKPNSNVTVSARTDRPKKPGVKKDEAKDHEHPAS
jgi:hypothetical protein